ncbi:MAG: hypothetical protein JNK85_22610 [Verrucomicrobiales bacterium]|nr:hypothetical protein [Verrucomicrobiales bacterium]
MKMNLRNHGFLRSLLSFLIACVALGDSARAITIVDPNSQANAVLSGTMQVYPTSDPTLQYQLDTTKAGRGAVQWANNVPLPMQVIRSFQANFEWEILPLLGQGNGTFSFFFSRPGVFSYGDSAPAPGSGLVINLTRPDVSSLIDWVVQIYWDGKGIATNSVRVGAGQRVSISYSSAQGLSMTWGGTVIAAGLPFAWNPTPDWQFGFGGTVDQWYVLAAASYVSISAQTAPFLTSSLPNRNSFQFTSDAFDLDLNTLEGRPEGITVTATVSNPEVFDTTNLTITATSPTRRHIEMTPNKHSFGTNLVSLRLDPGGGGPVTITNYAHQIDRSAPPTIQSFGPITQPQGFTQVLPVTVNSPHWPRDQLVMTIDSFPTNLIDPRAIYVMPPDSNVNERKLVFTPRLDATGSGDIVLRVTDPVDDFATTRIAVTTTAGSQAPTVLGAGTAISLNTASAFRQYAADFGNAAGTGLGRTATIETWVYPTALPDSTLNFVVHVGQPSQTQAAVLGLMSDGTPSFANWVNDFYPTNATRKVGLNAWHHLAVVLSGQSVTFYVDGQPSASGTLPNMPNIAAGQILIGREPTTTGDRHFTGHLDEIRIWSVARSPQDIADNYNRAVRPDAPGLLRYFRCDEGFLRFDGGVGGSDAARTYFSGRLVDSSVNQQSISLVAFPAYVPGVPLQVSVDVEQDGSSTLGLATVITGNNAWGSGGVVREIFFGPDSTALGSGLGSSPGWPGAPDVLIANGVGVEVAPGALAQYGQRTRGLLLAPETGTYTFAIASANEGQLWLGTNATPASSRLVATSPATGVSFRQFDAQPAQQTFNVSLTAGQRYYFEVRHQSGSGGTVSPHLSVQWTLPGGTVESPIPAYRLQPLGTPPAGNTLTLSSSEQPAWGSLAIAGNAATYQPQANYFGPDDFAFTARNGTLSTPPALVQVNVLNRDPAPIAGSGNALQLGGSPGGVERTPGFDLGGTSFTLEMWARRANATSPGSGNVQALFSFSSDPSTNRPQATFGYFDDGRVGLQMSATLPSAELLSSATYHTNLDWHHWAAVFDATTGRREIFLDGVSLGSITNNGTTLGVGGFYLGSVSGKSGFFQGTLDEVRLWKRALTPEELFDTMNTTLVGTEPDLYLYYRFDEGNGLVAYDSSPTKPGGVRFDGTIVNPVVWTTNAAPSLAQIVVPGNSRNQKFFLPGFAFDRSKLTYQITGVPTNGVLAADPIVPGLYTFTPTRRYSGTNVISYTVTDGRGLVSPVTTLLLVVDFVPIPPTISSIRDQELEEEDPPLVVPFGVTDEDQPDGSRLTFAIRSSSTTLLPAENIVVSGSGTSRTLTLTPVDGEVGDSTIEITVNNGIRTATTAFEVRVNPRLAFAVVNAGAVVQQPSSFATAINGSGQLAGYVASIAAPTNSSPFFYTGYGATERGYITANLGGTTGAGLAVNASGVMVGAAKDAQNASLAFVIDPRQDSIPSSLGVLPGGNLSVATGINDDGLIVGYAQTGDGTFRAFTAGTSVLAPLALTNGYASMWATAVNAAGEIAGYARLASGGNTNAFLSVNGLTQDLGRPAGADDVVVTAISDQGLVVGNALFPSGARSRVATYEDGTWTDLGDMFGGGAAEASGVNRFGQIVGRALTTNGVWRAFLYTDGRAYDLNALSPGSGWTLTDARGINDRAQIAANGALTNAANQALVLFPATEIGRRVFRPDGAIGENPNITILQGAGTDRWDNSFFWSAIERKLYAIRPVVAEIRWRTGTFVTVTNDTQFGDSFIRQIFTNEVSITTLSFNVWPTDPVIHVAGAPVQVQPDDPGFRHGFVEVSYPTGEQRVDSTTKLFNSQTTGYSVLHYLRTDGRPQNPENQPNHFTVVRTIAWNDPAFLVTNVPWTVGLPITNALHQDYAGLNGYVLTPNAYFDGAGTNAAYQLATRRGPILPVNSNERGENFLVVWYRQDRIGTAWASLPYQYAVRWPTDAEPIIIASQLGSGPLSPATFPRSSIYSQSDTNLPGYNPNEEHALFSGGTLYALRNDLNARVTPKASEPYVLLRYLDPVSGEWRMKVYSVVAEQHPYTFQYDGVVGHEIQPPLPISALPLMSAQNRLVSGPAWQDYRGRFYARAAGIDGSEDDVVLRFFYPLQPGFFYDLDRDGTPEKAEGDPIPWLEHRDAGELGQPVDVTYVIQWPQDPPVLQVGQSLTTATGGLPDIADMASTQVVFDSGDPSETRPLSAVARLFDPLSDRSISLEEDFVFPDAVRRQVDPSTGTEIFPDLPYYLRVRLYHDARNHLLGFRGFVYAPSDGAASVTLVNVMSQREREVILALDPSGDQKFADAIEDLYAITRNPNRLDLTGDGLPDESLLIGLASQVVTNNGLTQTNLVRETLKGAKALTAAQPLLDVQPSSKGGLRFAATGQGMKVTNNFVGLANDFTIEFWVRPESSRPSTPETASGEAAFSGQPFAVYPDQASAVTGQSTRAGIGVSVGTNGVSVVEHSDYLICTPLVYDGDLSGWRHIAVVYRDATPSLYIDGQLVRTGVRSLKDVQPSASLVRTSDPWGGYGVFAGSITDLRIWDHPRSQLAIIANSDRQLTGKESGLAGLWLFAEGQGATVADLSPSGSNGVLAGSPTWITDGPDQPPGPRFVVVAENDDPSLGGLPVGLHVIRVDADLARGSLAIIQPDNVLDERVTLRHSADFAGQPDAFVFQWLYQVDAPGFDPTFVPLTDNQGAITDNRNWVPYPTDPASGLGVNDLTLGSGTVSSLLTLSDVWYLMRYGEITPGGGTNWSSWIGDPSATAGAPRAMFVPGWIKRVLGGINLFAQRGSDFDDNQVNTLASTLAEAGPRYEGDVALNPATTDNFGLIEIYSTVLNRGRGLSIDGTPAVAYEPADKALLLAAGNIADLYLLHANEAFADSADPTIGLTTDSTELGSVASSIFAFQNQVSSLLEEELAMLRGRDDSSAGVGAAPVYNRLFWNFTGNEGETAYVAKYGIPDQNSDGFINAGDAKILFPQGHGDAWGHYLTALTSYYDLLRHPNFIWIPRPEDTLVAGVPIQVNYQDERRFARAAAARARTGAEIVDRSHRLGYTDDPVSLLQGFPDPVRSRAWSVSGWARRASQGAYFDWVVGNAILPTVDPDNHVGIQKVDRTTVGELMQIVTEAASVVNVLDQANAGLNPLGFARGVVPFDIDPDLVRTGFQRSSHFEQIYQRALQALQNAEVTFNRATVLSSELRKQQNSVSDYSVAVANQEIAYLEDLIQIYGYPYAGDIGPGGTYPSGYQGPDLLHWMYVPTVDVTAQNNPRSEGFTDLSSTVNGIQSVAINIKGNFAAQFSQTTLDALDATKVPDTKVEYPIHPGDYTFETPASWGQRRAEGSLQGALRELVLAQVQLRQALTAYENHVSEIEEHADLLELRYGLRREQLGLGDAKVGLNTVYNVALTAANVTKIVSQNVAATFQSAVAGLVGAVPSVVGLATDAFAPIVASIYVASMFAEAGPTALAEGAEIAEQFLELAKEETELGIDLQVETNEQDFEVAERLKELEVLVRAEASLRLDLFNANQAIVQAARNIETILAQGQRLLVQRTLFRKVTAGTIQADRYRDLGLRIFRDDSLQKYDAQFEIAARYVHLAAAAYDYELNLGTANGAGSSFATEILRERSLGELVNDEPVVGRVGLASILGRMRQNFDVLRGQVGLNNDRPEDSRFSLRSEAFRILPSTSGTNVNTAASTTWRQLLQSSVVSNLWDVAEFRRYCRPFAPESAGPQPGIVLRFGSTVVAGQNFFGQALGPLDSSYDPSEYSTRIKSVAVWFSDYDAADLAAKPRVYLVPVGVDRLRSADADDFSVRDWQVIDQRIPVPFPIGNASLSNSSTPPIYPSSDGTFTAIRRHSAFRAYQDTAFDLDQFNESTRLIGRSVWNTQWVLIIPGAYLLGDPNPIRGLDLFIQSVDDIKLYFQTYSTSGN